MSINPKYTVHGDTVQIISGFSCVEVIDRSGKTISGNVRHVDKIRNIAMDRLRRGLTATSL